MFQNAYVAKLNQHLDDPIFVRVLSEIQAALEEGLPAFEVYLTSLGTEARMDLVAALDVMEYIVEYDDDTKILGVELP